MRIEQRVKMHREINMRGEVERVRCEMPMAAIDIETAVDFTLASSVRVNGIWFERADETQSEHLDFKWRDALK